MCTIWCDTTSLEDVWNSLNVKRRPLKLINQALTKRITTYKEQSMGGTCLTICYSFPKFKEMIDAKQKILELAKEIRLIEVNGENVDVLASSSTEPSNQEIHLTCYSTLDRREGHTYLAPHFEDKFSILWTK